MSEKRFTETERNCYYTSLVFDNQTQEELGTPKVVDLLNEQQATITELKKDLKTVIDSYDCERIGYCHKGEYCKKWSLNNDR